MRDLTVTLKPVSGAINYFYASVNDKSVIQEEGTAERSATESVPDKTVNLKVRVVGIGRAKYQLSIDLPGTADDQSLDLQLDGGYHEIEIKL